MEIPEDVMKNMDVAQRFYNQNKKAIDAALKSQRMLSKAIDQSGMNKAIQFANNNHINMKKAFKNDALNNVIISQKKLNDAIEKATIDLNIKNEFSNVYNTITKTYNLDLYSNNDELYLKGKNSSSSIKIKNTKDLIILDKIIDNITVEECTDFINHMSDFPLLGLKHNVSDKIYSFIAQQEKINIRGINLFRIRISTDKKQIPYTVPEMFEPQFRSPRQNRFSMSGLNPLYLCNDFDTAKLEVGLTLDMKYTIIEIELTSDLNILDICNDQIPLFNFCHHRPESSDSNLHIEYLIPNFIADCAKHAGFDGIQYSSIHNPDSKNLVLFHTSRRDFRIINTEGFNY